MIDFLCILFSCFGPTANYFKQPIRVNNKFIITPTTTTVRSDDTLGSTSFNWTIGSTIATSKKKCLSIEVVERGKWKGGERKGK